MIGKDYLMRQAATLLRKSANPKVPALLAAKAADLKSRSEEHPADPQSENVNDRQTSHATARYAKLECKKRPERLIGWS
jgi:hypothetical protein